MTTNVSPGVYTKITDLSTYVQQVPGSIGCTCGLTKKGEDNVFKFYSSTGAFLRENGEPNIEDFGRHYSQGPYIAYNFLTESGAFYFMRCMPDNASFANLRIDIASSTDGTGVSMAFSYVDSTAGNTKSELRTAIETSGVTMPLGIFHPIGRGEYYNSYAIRIAEAANPMKTGVYTLDIYEIQSDGSDVIVESFEISFEPTAKDNTGTSIFIEDVLARYSSILRFIMTRSNDEYTDGYKYMIKTYDKNIGDVVLELDSTAAFISDSKQDFTDWQTTDSTTAEFCVIAKDEKGNEIYGWLGEIADEHGESIYVYDTNDLGVASLGWAGGDVGDFRETGDITYEIRKSFGKVSWLFPNTAKPLKKGSDGSLLSSQGIIDTTSATQVLDNAFRGLLHSNNSLLEFADQILDTEFVYFSLVFDAGYPTEVKSAIVDLARTSRQDCVAILDNGDNATATEALASRQSSDGQDFNTFYAALYECYNKVYDSFSGRDIWVSPIYHMAYVLPRNDRVSEVWYAAAGFDYVLDSIKELRYSPKLGDRDQFYLKQINPFVKFREGIVPYGQLTTQSRPSAMQDLNIVRLVLYCKVALERYCRYYIFKLNDMQTWDSVGRDITQFLEAVKAARGLYSYEIEVSATDYEIKQKKFHVNVTLYPTRVSEQIELNFFIK